jgi:hypothetical protein
LLPVQDLANRECNLCWRQGGDRDLIEQRLEEMMVGSID